MSKKCPAGNILKSKISGTPKLWWAHICTLWKFFRTQSVLWKSINPRRRSSNLFCSCFLTILEIFIYTKWYRERQSGKKKRREKIWSLVEPTSRSCSSALDLVQQGDLLEDISNIFVTWRFKRFSLPCFRLWGQSLSSGRTQSRCKRRWSDGEKW